MTGGEVEGGGAGQDLGVLAGRGPGAGGIGGAGALRGTAGGRPPPGGAAAQRSARSQARHHLGGKRGGAEAGAKSVWLRSLDIGPSHVRHCMCSNQALRLCTVSLLTIQLCKFFFSSKRLLDVK